MKVILLQKVRKLGDLGDEISVRKGFGRNFLIPQGIAVPATKHNIEHFNAERSQFEQIARKAHDNALKRAVDLDNLRIEYSARAGDEGRLFGSVGPIEITHALEEQGHKVTKQEVKISEPIRHIGEYEVELHLHSDVTVKIQLVVSPAA